MQTLTRTHARRLTHIRARIQTHGMCARTRMHARSCTHAQTHTYTVFVCLFVSLGLCDLFFVWCFVATQLARQLQQERLQVVYSNKEAWKRLAQRHSRNGPWIHECCFEVIVGIG